MPVLAAGFTLIEVLVAVAIVAVALSAALRAAGQGTTQIEEMRARLLAGWVAENHLAEQRARGEWVQLGSRRGAAEQAGTPFAWREEVTALPRPVFRRVDVFVYRPSEEARVLARLTGIVARPAGTP